MDKRDRTEFPEKTGGIRTDAAAARLFMVRRKGNGAAVFCLPVTGNMAMFYFLTSFTISAASWQSSLIMSNCPPEIRSPFTIQLPPHAWILPDFR